jgi:hypothetical protein
VLAVGRGAALVFRAHNPLKRRKVQFAKRVVLTAEQTLSSTKVLNRLGPDVHHLAAYERFDRFSFISGKKPQPVHGMRSVINAELCERHGVLLLLAYVHTTTPRGTRPSPTTTVRRRLNGALRRTSAAAASPLDNDRSGNHQTEENRHHYWRDDPLMQFEF